MHPVAPPGHQNEVQIGLAARNHVTGQYVEDVVETILFHLVFTILLPVLPIAFAIADWTRSAGKSNSFRPARETACVMSK